MKIELKPIPNVAHEKINAQLQRIWAILINNRSNGSFISSTYPANFNIVVEWELYDCLLPTKIRGQIGKNYFSIAIDRVSNGDEISIKCTELEGRTLTFSNKQLEATRISNSDRISVSEWSTRITNRTRRMIGQEAMKQCNQLLDLIISNLSEVFKSFDKAA